MHNLTRDEIRMATEIVFLIRDAIRDVGSIPSGHLYAQLMPYMSLGLYMQIIKLLKDSGVIREENHLLIYVGRPLS